MEIIFGDILLPEAGLEQFYSAKQSASETVASWTCRIEDILFKFQDKKGEHASKPLVDSASAKTMVHTKFFSGLRPGTVKNAIRHTFDADATYEDLLVAAMVAKLEDDDERKTTTRVHQTSTTNAGPSAKLDKVLASLGSVQSRFEKLERREHGYHSASNDRHPKPFTGNCFGCGQPVHPKFRCPLNQQRPASGSGH